MKTLILIAAVTCCSVAFPQYQHAFHVDSIGGPSYEVSNSKTGFEIQSSGASSKFVTGNVAAKSGFTSQASSADAASGLAGVQYYQSAAAPVAFAPVSGFVSAGPGVHSIAPSAYSGAQSSHDYHKSATPSFGGRSSSGYAANSGVNVNDQTAVVAHSAPVVPVSVVVPHPVPVAHHTPTYTVHSDAGANQNTAAQSSQSFTFGSSGVEQAAGYQAGHSSHDVEAIKPVVNTAFAPSQAYQSAAVKSSAAGFNAQSGSLFGSGVHAIGGFGAQSVQNAAHQSSVVNRGVVPANVHVSRAGPVFGAPFVAGQSAGSGLIDFAGQAKAFGYQNAAQANTPFVAGHSGSAGSINYGQQAQALRVQSGAQQAAQHPINAQTYSSQVSAAQDAQHVNAAHSSSVASQGAQVSSIHGAQGASISGSHVGVPSFRSQSGFGSGVSNFGTQQAVQFGAKTVHDSGFGSKTAYGVKNAQFSGHGSGSGFAPQKVAFINKNFQSAPSSFGARINQGIVSQTSTGLSQADSAYVVDAQSDSASKAASVSNYGAGSGSYAYGAGFQAHTNGAHGAGFVGAPYVAQTAVSAGRQAYPIGSNAAFNAAAAHSYILRQNQDQADDGSAFAYSYDTENGISVQSDGQVRNAGTDAASLAVTGSYSYTGDDGKVYTIHYVADERGFVPVGEHISLLSGEIARSVEYNLAHPEEWNIQN